MKLFEFMGKELFAQYGIPVPTGQVARTLEEAFAAGEAIGEVVVKSQVLTGKRGKSGGIGFASGGAEAKEKAAAILGMEIQGLTVDTLLVEEKLKIDKEYYLAIAVDGVAKMPLILASAEGGMDIEDVAEDLILKKFIDPQIGIQPFMARDVSRVLGLSGDLAKQVSKILFNLYRLFKEKDAELVEINPLVLSGDRIIAADAKVTIDDDALYRQKGLPVVEEKTAIEKKAHELGLAYVELGGDIAVMANGAGVTMATLDLIEHYGGKPANFLDAGGGAGEDITTKALEMLLSTNPRAIIINIFGGITRCDDVANAFANVKKKMEIKTPVVIRLVGTNEDQGRKILEENGIDAYKMMHEAAAKVVELAQANQGGN